MGFKALQNHKAYTGDTCGGHDDGPREAASRYHRVRNILVLDLVHPSTEPCHRRKKQEAMQHDEKEANHSGEVRFGGEAMGADSVLYTHEALPVF
jgi:hypothetical protein